MKPTRPRPRQTEVADKSPTPSCRDLPFSRYLLRQKVDCSSQGCILLRTEQPLPTPSSASERARAGGEHSPDPSPSPQPQERLLPQLDESQPHWAMGTTRPLEPSSGAAAMGGRSSSIGHMERGWELLPCGLALPAWEHRWGCPGKGVTEGLGEGNWAEPEGAGEFPSGGYSPQGAFMGVRVRVPSPSWHRDGQPQGADRRRCPPSPATLRQWGQGSCGVGERGRGCGAGPMWG